jgi:hypothetical protein
MLRRTKLILYSTPALLGILPARQNLIDETGGEPHAPSWRRFPSGDFHGRPRDGV